MPIRFIGLLCGGLLLLSGSTALAAGPINTTIRVEGSKKTLVAKRSVTLAAAPLNHNSDGHDCPGQSAAGALEQGTGGAWSGSWNDTFSDYLVKTIRGETHGGTPDYWSVWVNHRASSGGVCTTDLKKGDDVLFFVDRCVFDTATSACKNKPVLPLGLIVPARVTLHHSFMAKVVRYSATGKTTPVAGATILAKGKPLPKKTNSQGKLRLTATHVGRLHLQARKSGLVRTESVATRITS